MPALARPGSEGAGRLGAQRRCAGHLRTTNPAHRHHAPQRDRGRRPGSTLTSREQINAELRGVLDEATGKWGIRVNRVELKAIDPPGSIKDAMEKQLRAERDKRAAILTAEGLRQSQILTAEGAKQSAILTAEGQQQSQVLVAEGQAKAIDVVFTAIHDGHPDAALLAYQYLQMLPKIAEGHGSQVWMIPSELTKALDGFASAFGSPGSSPGTPGPNGAPPFFF